MGKRIPYKKIGFNSLEALLKSESSLMIKKIDGDTFVDAHQSEKSSHISDLVRKQKSSKPKG